MRKALIYSIVLHAAIFLISWIGLPVFITPLPPPPVVIPVEVTEIGAMTNTRIAEKQEDKPPRPATKPQKPAPPPPQQTEKPQDSKDDAKAEVEPDEKAEALPDKKKPDKKKPEEKKPKQDMLASVLKNVAKLKTTAPSDAKPETKEAEEAPAVNNAPALADRLMLSEEDALRRQIAQCWNMPVGARNAEELIVEVYIEVNPDRTVRLVEIVDRSRMGSDPHFRAAAEAAVRALRNPRCSPLELPPEKYDQWKAIRFNFDPRDML